MQKPFTLNYVSIAKKIFAHKNHFMHTPGTLFGTFTYMYPLVDSHANYVTNNSVVINLNIYICESLPENKGKA
jgi:hypothetical protein